MLDMLERNLHCPYCGELLHLLVDPSELGDSYIEDCQVCCAPITLRVVQSEGEIILEAYSQDEI